MPVSEWFEETPAENSYDLTMFDGGGASVQEVQLTRDEYIKLKAFLGSLRGFGSENQPSQRNRGDQPDDEKQRDRAYVIEFIRDKLKDRDMDLMLIFAEALHRHNGCGTPAEDFVREMVAAYPMASRLEDVREALKEFDLNFQSLQQDAAYLNRFYPKLADGAAEAGRVSR